MKVSNCPKRYMPKVVFAFVLGYISLSHLYRAYVDYMGWSLDFTGPQVTNQPNNQSIILFDSASNK